MKFIHLSLIAVLAIPLFLASCNNDPAPVTQTPAGPVTKDTVREKTVEKPTSTAFTFHAVTKKDSARKTLNKRYTADQRYIIYALNRLDAASAKRPDTLIVPDTVLTDMMAYSPFPAQAPFLKDVAKIVFFSYPIQAFGAYEHGTLVHWGPTSMGKKATPTPTGLFFSNWKAKETISTVSDEWKLKWNFNISNHGGVGWHQYAMPGYPASHSCLRMLEADAQYMYSWADQWVLQGNDKRLANGTPTIVYGAYPFGHPRPWFTLLSDPNGNSISEDDLKKEAEAFLPKILAEQENRAAIVAAKASSAPTSSAQKDTLGEKK